MTNKTDNTALVIAEELNEWAREYAPTELATALATCAAVLLKNQNARIAELEALQAAPPAPAAVAVPDERDAEIAGLTASVGHLSALVDGQQATILRAKAAMTALHNSASPIDESRGDLDARIPEADFRQFVDEHAALIHAIAQSPVAAAPAQEHATQLAGQGQEVTDAMALAFHHAITDGAIGQDDVEEIKTGLRAVLCKVAAPAQAQEDARDLEAEALRACRDLPEGWEIEIHLERGYGVVTVIDPQGNDDELPVEGTLFDALRETIDTAIRDDAARAAQGGA